LRGEVLIVTHSSEDKRTALYDFHKKLGAKIVPFGGWMMPVSYSSVLEEHQAVREACGIFDVSHMGEIRVSGPDALSFLQYVTTNDVEKLKKGNGQYTAMLRPSGGMVDDLILYRTGDQEYFLCVNAGNMTKDYSWLVSQKNNFHVSIVNESSDWSQLALQGPNSKQLLLDIMPIQGIDTLAYTDILSCEYAGKPCYVARTGYTGEKGYEIYLSHEGALHFWTAALEKGQRLGIRPIGLGARDTLRLEACYLLYGNDMNDDVTPLEAGIAWATKLAKPEFLGKASLLAQKERGVPRQSVAFKFLEPGVPRQGMDVFFQNNLIGKVTSGSVLPTVGGAGGLALLSTTAGIGPGSEVEVDVRGKRKRAQIVKKPIYQARTKD
jgi:aminomethyltransferase